MTRQMRLAAVLAIASTIGGVLAGCQPEGSATLSSADEAILRGIFDKAITTARAGDWASFAAQFSEDAAYHPPNEPAIMGRAAIQRWSETGRQVEAIEFPDVKVWGGEDFAYGTADYLMTLRGQPEDSGKQLVVFRRGAAGKWEVVAVSWNSDLPTPAQPAAASRRSAN